MQPDETEKLRRDYPRKPATAIRLKDASLYYWVTIYATNSNQAAHISSGGKSISG